MCFSGQVPHHPEREINVQLNAAEEAEEVGGQLDRRPEQPGQQVWSLSSFDVSCQLLTNDLNQASSLSLAEATEEPGCSQVKNIKFDTI